MNPSKMLYFTKTHGSAILTVLGCIGVPVTAYLSGKAAVKSNDMVWNEAQVRRVMNHDSSPITVKDRIQLCWKYYIPTVISGTLTIASIVGSNRLSAKQIAALSAACAGLMSQKSEIEQEIRKRYGKEVLDDIREKYAKVLIYPEDTGNGDLLCFDAFGGRWFYSSEDAVNMALCELNDEFMNQSIELSEDCVLRGGYRCYNDLYNKWGISETHFGWIWGWAPNSDYYDGPILWSVKKVEGFMELDEPVLVIEPLTYPMECWMEV